jgi:hypothetical protein
MQMMKLLAALTLVCNAGRVSAAHIDRLYLAGLDVQIESPPGQTFVDGIGVQITSVTGPDAERASERILENWRIEAGISSMHTESAGPWTVYSRLNDGESEALQERRLNDQTQLLWSITTGSKMTRAIPKTFIALPSGCIKGRTVHGTDNKDWFIQVTGLCRGTASATLQRLEHAARRLGCVPAPGGDNILECRHGARQIEAQVIPVTTDAESGISALVLLDRSVSGASQ